MEDLEPMAVVARKIWFHRNFVVILSLIILKSSKKKVTLDDFRRLDLQEFDLRNPINEEASIFWKKPHIGFIKVN